MPKSKRMADCHPDRPHYAKGLCKQCYARAQYKKNRKRRLALMKEWRGKNPERKKKLDRKWREKNKRRMIETDRKWKENNRDRCQEVKLLKRYGLTLLEYDTMFEAQGGSCAICGEFPKQGDRRLYVDHDHNTGVVRGLLCHNCNLLLGFAQDDINVLAHAISYLEETGDPHHRSI